MQRSRTTHAANRQVPKSKRNPRTLRNLILKPAKNLSELHTPGTVNSNFVWNLIAIRHLGNLIKILLTVLTVLKINRWTVLTKIYLRTKVSRNLVRQVSPADGSFALIGAYLSKLMKYLFEGSKHFDENLQGEQFETFLATRRMFILQGTLENTACMTLSTQSR